METALKTPVLDMVRCTIGSQSFGLEMSWVRGVYRADQLRIEPGPNGEVGWLADPEGDVPVFSLAELLGTTPAASNVVMPHVIVLHGEPTPLALLVDHLSPVLRVPTESILALPPLAASLCEGKFLGVVQLENELMLWLSPEHLFPTGQPKREMQEPDADWLPEPRTNKSLEGRRPGHGQIVLFSTADSTGRRRPLSFGLSMTQVLEILDPPPIIRVPAAPDYLLGLTVWHTRTVPVLDLARRLGLEPLASDERTRLLIARASSGSEPIGLLVRPTIRVRHVPLPHIPCTQAPPIDLALTRGILELNDETLVIPDIGSIAQLEGAMA